MSLIIRQRLYNTCILRVSQGQAIHQAVRRNLWIRLLERVTGWKFKFSAGERISRVSIKGRSGRKDKVSTPDFDFGFETRFQSSPRAYVRRERYEAGGGAQESVGYARILYARIFSRLHLLLFFIENALRDANLFIYLFLERNNLNLPSWL